MNQVLTDRNVTITQALSEKLAEFETGTNGDGVSGAVIRPKLKTLTARRDHPALIKSRPLWRSRSPANPRGMALHKGAQSGDRFADY
jgi:hypothetical protein